jgi:putative thioredoxin
LPVPELPHVIEPTSEGFAVEVIERSHAVPVVVDFWAPWCQPCRILGPVLEKLAAEYGGKFVLAKVDTEKLTAIASGFGIRSIPAVFAIRDGQVVDSFVGVLPESALRAWIDRILPTPAEALVSEAKALEAADPEASRAKYLEAAALAPAEPLAKIGLARVELALGRPEAARDLISQLERRGFLEPEAENLKARLTLQAKPGPGEDIDALLEAHNAAPRDRARQLALAEALASASRYEEALEKALDLVEVDRRGTGEPARKLMIAVFQLLPPDSPLVAQYRRKLSVAL